MRAEKVFNTLLAGDAGVAAIVGTQLYAGFVPESASAPFLFIAKAGAQREYLVSVSGASPGATVTATMTVICAAASYPQLKALAEAVRLALVGRAGLHAGVQVHSLLLTDEGGDEYEPELKEFAQALTFTIAHSE